ncbi:Cytochrome P450 [Corchorus olitorius]|uniref:Cytochrome P450 n=1 Tax=Corchorus olitorius TaxID=93759 RepID=A0A1R3JMS4_9ROSI|nr:Cytochrome P450 [Corchorus olitorius]
MSYGFQEEQEEIIGRRPSSQKGLTLDEIKQMKYLFKVIDETLRIRTNTFALFREAKEDTELNGYLIPKGWKVLVWTSDVHITWILKFIPIPMSSILRDGDDLRPKAGTFQPFGAGSSSCPGAGPRILCIDQREQGRKKLEWESINDNIPDEMTSKYFRATHMAVIYNCLAGCCEKIQRLRLLADAGSRTA